MAFSPYLNHGSFHWKLQNDENIEETKTESMTDLRKYYLAKKRLDSVHSETPEGQKIRKEAKNTTRVVASSTNLSASLKDVSQVPFFGHFWTSFAPKTFSFFSSLYRLGIGNCCMITQLGIVFIGEQILFLLIGQIFFNQVTNLTS